MSLLATVFSGAAAAAEPLARGIEVPEPVSMALLSVVLAGVSMVVPRTGTKADDRGRGGSGPPLRP